MHKSVHKLQSVHLAPTSPIKLFVWRFRRGIRVLLGRDMLEANEAPLYTKVRGIYVKLDQFIVKLLPGLEQQTPRDVALKRIRDALEHELRYKFFDVDEKRPWGGYFRIADESADRFITEFFPGLSAAQARFGRKDVALSPKILVIAPGQRFSWQYHEHRTERWHFLTPGSYYRSLTDKPGEEHQAAAGEIVQFATGERHRGCAAKDSYTLIAEIWQHTDPKHISDESDIIRLSDDYDRK